jgi:hypothetical protein
MVATHDSMYAYLPSDVMAAIEEHHDPIYVPLLSDDMTAEYYPMSIEERFEPCRIALPASMPGTPPLPSAPDFETYFKPMRFVPKELVNLHEADMHGCGKEGVSPKKTDKRLFGADPIHKELGEKVAKLSLKLASKSNRWWTSTRLPLTCRLSGFPINLLPYPPFKLRVNANEPNPHSLVDGKFLALRVIASGSLAVRGQGQDLSPSEITTLGQYMQKCKLGPFRP